MKTYNVIVRAIITKTMVIKAENEDDAIQTAQDTFTVQEDGNYENYDQEILDAEEVQ